MRQSRSMFFQSLYRYIVSIVDLAEATMDFAGLPPVWANNYIKLKFSQTVSYLPSGLVTITMPRKIAFHPEWFLIVHLEVCICRLLYLIFECL